MGIMRLCVLVHIAPSRTARSNNKFYFGWLGGKAKDGDQSIPAHGHRGHAELEKLRSCAP